MFHVDHVTAISKGGSNGPENLQLLCAPCNLRKGAK
jgi:5-methylcytosine-specific restriction endonuclease McrA